MVKLRINTSLCNYKHYSIATEHYRNVCDVSFSNVPNVFKLPGISKSAHELSECANFTTNRVDTRKSKLVYTVLHWSGEISFTCVHMCTYFALIKVGPGYLSPIQVGCTQSCRSLFPRPLFGFYASHLSRNARLPG